MANSFDTDGRGPSNAQLLACGIAMVVAASLLTTGLVLKSTGRFNDYVPVVADLVNVGDGLPAKSDVKYHGVVVGSPFAAGTTASTAPTTTSWYLTSDFAGSPSPTFTRWPRTGRKWLISPGT